MTSLQILLPDSMKTFVEKQAVRKGFESPSEYIREVIEEIKKLQTPTAKRQ